MGFRYYGPIDGHDLDSLIDAMKVAKAHNHSVLLHVYTTKGKGYDHAERDPSKFHGIGEFNIETGEPIPSGATFSSLFGESLVHLAENDTRICAVTAAMTSGTGLSRFAEEFTRRFFDVGIAEQHAVTFSSGLAKNGLIPVFAVYSTFLQRSYDQLVHDVAMQGLKVIFCIDRAGFVGEDGESHQGLFDTAYLMSVPELTVFAPTYFDELSSMLYQAVYKEKTASAIRYPRGGEPEKPEGYSYDKDNFNVFGNEENETCLVSYGREFVNCYNAMQETENTYVIKLNRIKPLDKEVVSHLKNAKRILFFEEGIKNGGVGEAFAELLEENAVKAEFVHIAVDNEFVKQAPVPSQIKKYGLDKDSIINRINTDGKENQA